MGDGSTLGMPRFDPKGKSRAATPSNGDILALDLDSAEEGTAAQNGDAFMQMQLVEQQVRFTWAYSLNRKELIPLQDTYIQSRSTAIESIESTISELGQIFTQLAQMVAEQRETVQRIDADTVDIASNVSGAQRELLKYYASISSNRWLMLKVFGVLIVFVSRHLHLSSSTVLRNYRPVPCLHPGLMNKGRVLVPRRAVLFRLMDLRVLYGSNP